MGRPLRYLILARKRMQFCDCSSWLWCGRLINDRYLCVLDLVVSYSETENNTSL